MLAAARVRCRAMARAENSESGIEKVTVCRSQWSHSACSPRAIVSRLIITSLPPPACCIVARCHAPRSPSPAQNGADRSDFAPSRANDRGGLRSRPIRFPSARSHPHTHPHTLRVTSMAARHMAKVITKVAPQSWRLPTWQALGRCRADGAMQQQRGLVVLQKVRAGLSATLCRAPLTTTSQQLIRT